MGNPCGNTQIRLGLPRPTWMTLALIIACCAIFIAMAASDAGKYYLNTYLRLGVDTQVQVWRLITFQFLHANPSHLLWNMVGLYFFGPPLERTLGRWKFLAFYLVCGVIAGMCFLALAQWYPYNRLVGASGGIFGCLMGCAILFPDMIVLIFPIRWVTAFLVLLYGLSIWWAPRGSFTEAAHLGGMVAAAGCQTRRNSNAASLRTSITK